VSRRPHTQATGRVPNREKRNELIAAAIYLAFFSVGTLGHYLDATRPLMLRFTPFVLLLFGLSSLVPLFVARAWKPLLWIAGTYIVTFALEATGVATGAIFGVYHYGPTLGPKILAVPVIIGFNWVVVVLGSISVAGWIAARLARPGSREETNVAPHLRWVIRFVAAPLLVGLLAVVFDLVLEPVAIRFDYWQWEAVRVPLRNYLAWFVIAALVSVPYFAMENARRFRLPTWYVAVQFLFILSLLPMAAA
jgi:uncharacterized membrane protein